MTDADEGITLGYIGNCHSVWETAPAPSELHIGALHMKRELGDRVEDAKTLAHLARRLE